MVAAIDAKVKILKDSRPANLRRLSDKWLAKNEDDSGFAWTYKTKRMVYTSLEWRSLSALSITIRLMFETYIGSGKTADGLNKSWHVSSATLAEELGSDASRVRKELAKLVAVGLLCRELQVVRYNIILTPYSLLVPPSVTCGRVTTETARGLAAKARKSGKGRRIQKSSNCDVIELSQRRGSR